MDSLERYYTIIYLREDEGTENQMGEKVIFVLNQKPKTTTINLFKEHNS